MPRAAELNAFGTVKEQTLARQFTLERVSGALGVKLEAHKDDRLLVNPANGTTYTVILCEREPDGTLLFEAGLLLAGDFTWAALLDPESSELHLILTKDLLALIQGGGAPGLVQRQPPFPLWAIGPSWAKQVSLIRRTAKLAKAGSGFREWRGIKLAQPEQFAHLHVHSMYSLLDGQATPEGLAKQVKLNGQPGVAITDHGYMFGTYKFYTACKDMGVKPILGCEVYLVDNVAVRYNHNGKDRRFEHHTTVLCMNDQGWENLCTLMSLACRDHFYYVPRIDHDLLFKYNEGLIVLSGCFKGPVAWYLQQFEPPQDPNDTLPPWYRTDPDQSYKIAKRYREVFGDRYYIELQSIDFERYMKAMPRIAQLSDDLKIPAVVTNDCHYEQSEDAIVQAIMTRISSNRVDEIGDRLKPGPYFMKQKSQIDPIGVLQEHHFQRTCEVLERCTLEFKKDNLFPRYNVEQDCDWAVYKAHKDSGK
jgi:hypothetical protein